MKLAADNLHGLNPVVIEAFDKLDPEPLRVLSRQFEEIGADFIDINPGRLSRKNEGRMAFLVDSVQSVSNLRLILDSPDPRILEIGLESVKHRSVVSALSLEQDKIEKILPLAKRHDAELVILLMDENSFTPSTVDEKLAIAIELRQICLEAGFSNDDLIFDPVLPNLTWPDAMFRIGEAIKTVRLLASGAVFQEPARTMCGLSNLRSGVKRLFSDRYDTLTMASLAGAGLDIILANTLDPEITQTFELVGKINS